MPTAGGVLYQPSGPASFAGTFSPAGSVEGSPMHTVYMSQPAPAAGGPYPSLPGAAAGEGAAHQPPPSSSLGSLGAPQILGAVQRGTKEGIPNAPLSSCSPPAHASSSV